MISKILRVAFITCCISLVCISPVAAEDIPTVIVQTSSDTPGVTTVTIIEPTPTQVQTMSAEYWATVRAAHQEHWETITPKTPAPIIGILAGFGMAGIFLTRRK